jgi:predicted ArsR family transcriptional regulator
VTARIPDAVAACEHAGRAWGRELVRRRDRAEQTGDDAAVGAVVDLLADHGFEPAANGAAIEMRRCPFHDLAETNPDVVCRLHRGLIDGALTACGSTLAVRELEIFPEPELCVVRLAEPAAAGSPQRPRGSP